MIYEETADLHGLAKKEQTYWKVKPILHGLTISKQWQGHLLKKNWQQNMSLKIELLPAIIFSKVSNPIIDVSQESLNTKQPWKYNIRRM